MTNYIYSLRNLCAGWVACSLLSGCAVVSVASTAVSVTSGVVGLAADATIGTARIVGKGVGKAADAMLDAPDTPSPVEATPTSWPAQPASWPAPAEAAVQFQAVPMAPLAPAAVTELPPQAW